MKTLALTCAALLIAGPVLAQSATQPANDATPKAGAPSTGAGTNSTSTPNTANPATPGQPASVVSTKDFVTKVAQSDMFEIQSSQLIDKGKATDDATATFARQMIEDHGRTTTELKQLLPSAKVEATLPKSMSKAQQKKLEALKDLKGDARAAHYARDQVDAHQKAVDLFRAYSNTGDNEALKKWAADTLPELEQHLKMAQKLRK